MQSSADFDLAPLSLRIAAHSVALAVHGGWSIREQDPQQNRNQKRCTRCGARRHQGGHVRRKSFILQSSSSQRLVKDLNHSKPG